jgi:outer membrane protein assembly factor BamB
VVFTSTLDGTIYGLDASTGTTLWRTRAGAGINACPSIAGGMLFVPAGVPVGARRSFELVAYGDGD